jgi:hypothetical protein
MVSSLAEAQSHNVPPETFLRHYRTIRDCASAHKDTGMALARAKKSAKGAGIDLDAFKVMQGFAKLDSDEAELQFRNLIRYAKWAEIPLGTQADMWGEDSYAKVPDEALADQREWEAGDAGLSAGRAGRKRTENPYSGQDAASSREHAAWDREWAKGHKTWLAGQKMLAGELGANAGVPADQATVIGRVNGVGSGKGRKVKPAAVEEAQLPV